MTQFIAISNQKGGTGKTTSAVHVAAGAAQFFGKKVLLVDVDPLANGTNSFLAELPERYMTVEHLMKEAKLTELYQDIPENYSRIKIEDIAISVRENLDLIPADAKLEDVTVSYASVFGREQLLRHSLGQIVSEYDLVVFDCPANFDLLTMNAFCIGPVDVFVPIECGCYSAKGFMKLVKKVKGIRAVNPDLKLKGAFVTKFDRRESISHKIWAFMYKNFRSALLDVKINISSKVKNAPLTYKTVYEFAPDSRGATEYKKLTELILQAGA
ncbi:ParA family protein [Halodesulfovibrio sp.]|jgi:chromosome partitioning protein|uniref:ParA family protein n=1 Tax=Halodesulfovibrio sp. TaxID=1912772 RepID=UPI0025CCF83A|nr:ParA family protein [Halodesulfovibrio sp.]MCT4533729.1 ParA family protein [Halodesulfovibrio sp.]